MVDFFYKTCGKTDLVTIGAVTVGCLLNNLLLRELALQCLGLRTSRVGCAGHSHCLVDISSS